MSKRSIALSSLALLLALTANGAQPQNTFSPGGRLEQIGLGRGWIDLRTDLNVPLKGWSRILRLGETRAAQGTVAGAKRWSADVNAGAARINLEQTVREEPGKLVFNVRASAYQDADIEGVYFSIHLPTELFAGGKYRLGDKDGALPPTLPEQFRLCSTAADNVEFVSPAGQEVHARIERATPLMLQDTRKWGQSYELFVYLHQGKLAAGQIASVQVTLSTAGDVEARPARLTLDAATERYEILGIGGNYCFNIDSPVTRCTLDNLNVAYARVEMVAEEWMPKPEASESEKIDWPALAARDVPGSRIRQEMELMRELSQKKIPYIASVWKLPSWMYTRPPDAKNHNNRIDDAKWPAVLKCIASYLLYAKEKYQSEAALFSFNEPNIGVRVLFNADEHREVIRRLGAGLRKHGLKTQMLLADVAGARGTHTYAEPTVADADALQYVGAISTHSWGGATPAQYTAWAELAEKTKRPLIIGEAGVDAGAWQGATYQSFEYGVREVAHYQELFLHARPQVVLLWEFTGDYSLLGSNKFEKSKPTLTERFCFQKQWCDFIPPGSKALKTSSDHPGVLLTAFASKATDGTAALTLQLSNQGWARPVTLTGIPAEIKTLNVVCTARGEMFHKLAPLPVPGGGLALELPGQCLMTLTTLPVPDGIRIDR